MFRAFHRLIDFYSLIAKLRGFLAPVVEPAGSLRGFALFYFMTSTLDRLIDLNYFIT